VAVAVVEVLLMEQVVAVVVLVAYLLPLVLQLLRGRLLLLL
jgi:hypothetical protein